jgi:hypothetical protein
LTQVPAAPHVRSAQQAAGLVLQSPPWIEQAPAAVTADAQVVFNGSQ